MGQSGGRRWGRAGGPWGTTLKVTQTDYVLLGTAPICDRGCQRVFKSCLARCFKGRNDLMFIIIWENTCNFIGICMCIIYILYHI